MNYLEYIKPELLALIPVLCLIGCWLKKSAVGDKWIPLLLGVVSMVLCMLWILSTTPAPHSLQDVAGKLLTAITQGILLAGVSVYGNQLIKQWKKDE